MCRDWKAFDDRKQHRRATCDSGKQSTHQQGMSHKAQYNSPSTSVPFSFDHHYRIRYLSQELAFLAGISGALHTLHIFIASSDGQIVKIMVPSGLKQLCPTAPVWAFTLKRRRYDGYECTVIESASGEDTATGRPVAVLGAFGSHDVPWVLRSSLEWGDHCRDVTAVFREMVWIG